MNKKSSSAELPDKERLYRDALARILAERKPAVPVSKRRKTIAEQSKEDERVVIGIKTSLYSHIIFKLYLAKTIYRSSSDYLKHTFTMLQKNKVDMK